MVQLTAADPSPPAPDAGGVARSAGILSLGNAASRVLGLVRQVVIATFFGASGEVSAWRVASAVPTMIYDLLIEGMLSAALVPVFSEYLATRSRAALWRLASVVLSLAAVVLAVVILLLEVFAEQVAWLMGGGFSPELLQQTASFIRIMLPAALIFGLGGILVGLLYALKRFTFPAISGAVFNLGIVVAAPLLARQMGIYALCVGVLLGASLQLVALLPGLRGIPLRFTLGWRNAGLRRIGLLYAPVVASLVVSRVQIVIDRNLASRTGEQSIAWMDNATTLFQFPHGLIAIAISLAVLPALSQLAASHDEDGYRATLLRGLRLVMVLILPASVGLFLLATPIIRLIYQHGQFTPQDTYWTATALRCYLLGLIFASLDWPLNYAMYARQNTLTPALVGVFSVGVYLVAALFFQAPLGRLGLAFAAGLTDAAAAPVGRLQMLGLVLADGCKHTAHALVMWLLVRRLLGGLPTPAFWQTTGKAAVGALGMGGIIALALAVLEPRLAPAGLWGDLALVALCGGCGGAAYLGLMARWRVAEVALLAEAVRARLRSNAKK
ncbi:MAG: murein biosynthesis integral membrane protein MurJ [Chloroflexi bacterium]|nr:murein biosynthesis integral membrane protein MurJ [Chloroflexota bacterium]